VNDKTTRREFLQVSAAAGISAVVGSLAGCNQIKSLGTKRAGSMIEYAAPPIEKVRVGYVGIGNMGSGHVNNLLKIPGCQVAAVCDIRSSRTDWAKKRITDAGHPAPAVYGKDDWDFKRMCETEDLDLVYNAAPWRWHAPICLTAMENGKHAASEVNIALTEEECWKLVETSEKNRKYCMMMENCCYDQFEMIVLNMIHQGVFGEVMHGECGYLHDLRGLKLSPSAYQGMWRVYQSIERNGNLYPTHGIGPMAWCMDINRGDAFDYLVSMNSPTRGLNEFAERMAQESKQPERREHYQQWLNKQYALGDVNVTLIKTKLGKTIICKHDTNLPRPYSRDFLVQGTKGLVRKYPTQVIHIEGSSKGHSWEDTSSYKEKYEHPVWKKTKEMAKGAGHGGMDFIEDYRMIEALRQGIVPDIEVYDSVAWSAIIPLSGKSSDNGSQPVKFDDYTRGAWKQKRLLHVNDKETMG
jgi:glycosyl hydrolase family 109/GFO/IDH/MocA oxidoreductase family protein